MPRKTKSDFRILALDQSTKCTGWSVVREDGTIENYGKIDADPKANVIDRIIFMYRKIGELIDIQKPSFVVFEGTQYQNNAGAFGSLSRLQGTIIALAEDRKLGFFIIEPTAWKAFCKIKGAKRDVQKENTKIFVAEKYGLIVTEDEADSIGIATWAHGNISKVGK